MTSFNSDDSLVADQLPASHPNKPHGIQVQNVFSNKKELIQTFNPLPSTSAKSSKLKLAVMLNSTIFLAGGCIHGRLEVSSKTSVGLKIGDILVELTGFEAVQHREVGSNNQSFLSARILFQGKSLPKSNAVIGTRDENGFWQAKKAKTVFPFSFKIPSDAPSSYKFQNLGSLRYVVTGVVSYSVDGKNDTMFKSSDAAVIESWKDSPLPPPLPAKAIGIKKSLVGIGSGEIEMHAILEKSLFVSGSDVYVQVHIKNKSKSKAQGLKLSLNRKILMLKDDDEIKVINEIVNESFFRDKNFLYDSGEERGSMLHIHIPPFVKSVRNTALAEVCCSITVSLNMGVLRKDLFVELPIIICNNASVQPPRQVDQSSNLHPFLYNNVDESEIDFEKMLKEQKVKIRKSTRGGLVIEKQEDFKKNIAGGGRTLPWDDQFVENTTEKRFVNDENHNVQSLVIEKMKQIDKDLGKRSEVPSQKISVQTNLTLKKQNPDISQELCVYIPANERSMRLNKKVPGFIEGMSGYDLSMALPEALYSFTEHSILDFSIGLLPNEPPPKPSKENIQQQQKEVLKPPLIKKVKRETDFKSFIRDDGSSSRRKSNQTKSRQSTTEKGDLVNSKIIHSPLPPSSRRSTISDENTNGKTSHLHHHQTTTSDTRDDLAEIGKGRNFQASAKLTNNNHIAYQPILSSFEFGDLTDSGGGDVGHGFDVLDISMIDCDQSFVTALDIEYKSSSFQHHNVSIVKHKPVHEKLSPRLSEMIQRFSNKV